MKRALQPSGNRREIFGWVMYDWANSTFTTTVSGALLAPYITSLAQAAVGDNGVVFKLGPFGSITAKSFFPVCIAISVVLQVFILPGLGAMADYSHLKKRLFAGFCYAGVGATCLMYFIAGDRYIWGGLLFIVANLSFGAAVVLYNAFLPEICPPEDADKVSSRGYAMGYMGGGLLLALNFALLLGAKRIGLTPGQAVRLSLLSAGIWWGGFSLVTFAFLKTRAPVRRLAPGQSYFRAGLFELGTTFRELARLPHTLRYLAGYLFYNDGIQTVLAMASVFMSQELFTPAQRAAGDDQTFVLEIYLLVQFVGFFGAFAFERIAALAGTKKAIMISLVIWCGIVVYAYGFVYTPGRAWGMGIALALVLAGSQALSRSLFARMIPDGFEASFFGLYEISERGTSWIGQILFAIVVGTTGSYRQAILSIIVLLIAGTIILALTDTDRAVEEAQSTGKI